jgi:capsular exopolysaccharide synthesis family protein
MLTSVYLTLWRRKWLIVLMTSILVGTVWFLTSRQTKLYTASTLVQVQQRVTNADEVFGALQTGERLARTYVVIAQTELVRQEVRDRLGDSVPPDAVAIDASQLDNLELLRLSVTNADPEVAARVANAVPAALQSFVKKNGAARDTITRIEPAGVPSTPSSPNLKFNIAVALLLGLILSAGVVLLIESLSDRAESAEELERLTGHPVIATIPVLRFASPPAALSAVQHEEEEERSTAQTQQLMVPVSGKVALAQAGGGGGRSGSAASGTASGKGSGKASGSRTQLEPRGPVRRSSRRALVDPASPSAEAFRTLRLAFQLRAEPGKGLAILVTSAEPGAGKSTLAANLAVVSALGRARVLLVDADLRKPVQHEIFGLARTPGLVELLAHGGSLERFLQRGADAIDVLTAGSAVARASDVLSSSRMADVLTDASGRYDVIVIDAAPVLATADAEGIAARSDLEVAFVVDRSTRRRNVVRAVRRLERLEAQFAGLVLNRDGNQELYGY